MAPSRLLTRGIALLISCLGIGLAAVRAGRESVTGEREPAGTLTEAAPAVESRALCVPDRVNQRLVSEPDKWLDSLAWFLTHGIQSDSHKVRAIHDWVTLYVRYDTAGLAGDGSGGQRVADVLRTRRSACGGYANLFGELCRLSGLKCVTVQGYARGAGFRVLDRQAPGQFEHVWNAVMVDGRWQLVDATWDSGWFRDGIVYEQHYSTDYLFPDPVWLVHTHLPDDPSWQLLAQPVSKDEFEDLPYLTAEFFRLGLGLESDLKRVSEPAGEFRVQLHVPRGVSVFCLLLAPDGRKTGQPIDGVRTGGSVRFSVAPPSAGDWVAVVLARRGTPGGRYSGVAFLGLRTAAPCQKSGTRR